MFQVILRISSFSGIFARILIKNEIVAPLVYDSSWVIRVTNCSERSYPMSKYRKCWESKPFLKEWIQEVPNDNTKAFCKACKIKLYAHRYSVLKHTATKKHQDNYKKLINNLKVCDHQTAFSENSKQIQQCSVFSEQNYSDSFDVNREVLKSGLEYLLVEGAIEDNALVYKESIDTRVFIDASSKVPEALQNDEHNETVLEIIPVENKQYEMEHLEEEMVIIDLNGNVKIVLL